MDEYVSRTYASAFHDRADRVQCKEELVEYLEANKMPTHPVARAIVEDSDDYVDITEAHYDIESDYERGWWNDIEEWDEYFDTVPDTNIKQSRKIRESVLQHGMELYADDGRAPTEHEAAKFAEILLGIDKEYAADEYVPELDLPELEEEKKQQEEETAMANLYAARSEDEIIKAIENMAEYEAIKLKDIFDCVQMWNVDFEDDSHLRSWISENTDAKVPPLGYLELKQ